MDTQDQLCTTCSKVDLFPLFTGPRYFPGGGYEHKVLIQLGTLAEINANTNCPLCRLLHHEIYKCEYIQDWNTEGSLIDTSKIRVNVHPMRVDYHEIMSYINDKTKDMLATRLETRLTPLDGLSEEEKSKVQHHPRGNGIMLLSPDSVDPARPLLNGYLATTPERSLELLKKWIETCIESHTIESKEGYCRRPHFQDATSEYGIRVIDVRKRTVVERNPEEIDYAAVSYVWGKDGAGVSQAQKELAGEADYTEGTASKLPSKIPKVVEDAMFICKKLSIPYLWIDRYCIDQNDLIRKGSEIEGMGYRYLYAKIIFIAGRGPEAGLLPESGSDGWEKLQKIEMIRGRKYITALPSIVSQIHRSAWLQRAWTMQEGQFANRCAFFGDWDLSFLCGSGHWRESSHSGPYGHEAELVGINTDCEGYYLLSWLNWLRKDTWSFGDYSDLLMSYSGRHLTFESDKLNAITGCLNLISQRKGVSFVYGLPTTDFHYALLWTREYDRPRLGFPSWSWAGWHSLQQMHNIYPLESRTCVLKDDGIGNFETVEPSCPDVELQGLYITLTERPHHKNKCSQRFASITFPSYKTNSLITITSQMAHFNIEILAEPKDPARRTSGSKSLKVPLDFDSTSTPKLAISWDETAEYQTPFGRFRLSDDSGNVHKVHYPRWYDHWPPFQLNLPSTLQGHTLAWLLNEGIELIMILELKMLEGDEGLNPFHLVLCLGVRRDGTSAAKRCGMFCLPKEIWDKAQPKTTTITMA